MSEIAIKIENLKKQYKLGAIGGQTLNAELQSWWARKRGKEDPNLKIGQDYSNYGESFYALNGINLEIKKGEALGIIGGNGAGKSTLLKILSRVTAPTEGDVWINGRIASMLEVGTGFHGELTGRENIYMNGAILGMTKKEVDEKIESIIDFSECRQFIDTPVKRYSSGMYVKLAFAVASHLDAEIMVMDEVLAVGDMKFQKKCLGKMGDEAAGGKTVLYVSHNMATIRNLCTRCIVLQKGQIIFDGDVERAIEIYMEGFAQDYPSLYDMNLLKRSTITLPGKVYIESIEFLNKHQAIYNESDVINIRIKWKEIERVEVLFRIVVIASDQTRIGLIDSSEVVNKKHEKNHDTRMIIDLSSLTPGKYALVFEAYRFDEGLSYQLDASPLIPICIEKDQTCKYINWHNEYWGKIFFPTIKFED